MNKESYVKAVAKRLTCSKARQAEFVRDLESDIAAALSAGETWEQVESRMGDPRQVAQEFNEDLSEAERAAGKKRKRTKTIAIVATVAVAVAAIIGAAAWWAASKLSPAGQSSNLSEQQVIEQAQKVAEVVGEGDYDKLRPMLDDAAAEALTEPVMKDAHALFGDDWGALKSFGNTYATGVTQMGMTGNAVNLVAIYENTTVTFDIGFNEDLKIIGLNMR